MTITEWGGVALVVAFVLYWLGKMPRTQVILAFIGTCVITNGLFGSILTRGALWLDRATNAVTGKLFGVAIPGLLVIVLGVIFVHDLMPKHSASRRTFWVGVALAACLVAGLSNFATLNNVPATVRTGVSNVSTIGG
jgi:hypothetical protein